MNVIKKVFSAITSDRQLIAGVIGILVILFIAFAAPLITSHEPAWYGPDSLSAPGEDGYFLGTNHLGQDVWTMLVYGTRTSLKVALVSAVISCTIGVLMGGVSGYFGGKIDRVVAEIINVFMMVPTLFLILLIVALFGNSITHVMIVIGLTSWPGNAKLMRAQALSLRERTFVQSVRVMGESKLKILFRHVIPNGIFPVISNTTMGMAHAILSEASLSFLGLGDPMTVSWGQMINDGKGYITTAWWVTALPGIAIVLTVLVFYLTGDGMNHVLNPKHKSKGA